MTPSALETLQSTLGDRYRFEREIGSGGMATVYLARDLRHDRQVAVKVLKPELGAVLGAERFLSEIKVTANLQHPNLLPLFDSGEAGGLLFYVMPFVEGETLRGELDREKQLSVEESVHIAVAVASALQYAHEHGVIHRDLKPENILIQAGQPVIADFGIALAVSKAGGARVTQTGLSLGTPQYMSPEQAAGDRVIDARSDIYSLGAVTYEMLGGEPPHSGSSAQAIIAKLMTSEPRPLYTLRSTVPIHVAAAVEKALAKLPADRFASAKDFAQALTNPHFTLSTRSGIAAQMAGSSAAVKKWKRATIAAGVLATLLLAVALWSWLKPQPVRLAIRNVIPLDSTQELNGNLGRVALSPDGSTIVYAGGPEGRLFVRRRDELTATALPGTEGAIAPFFSPDGNQVGYSTVAYALKVVSLKGGPPSTVTDSLVGRLGSSWGPDGDIYLANRNNSAIIRIAPTQGSKAISVTQLDTLDGEVAHRLPDALPNGKGFLFTVFYGGKGKTGTAIAVGDIASGKHTVLFAGVCARYSRSGHILYVTPTGTLMAVAFDQNKMRTTGDPIAIAEGLRLGVVGTTDLGVSRNGTLLYVTGGSQNGSRLMWVSRDGKAQAVDSTWQGLFQFPAISPDGSRLAVSIADPSRSDVWIKQLDTGPSLKLTFDGNTNLYPEWTPDGRSVTYYSNTKLGSTEFDLWTKRADGSAQAVRQLHQKLSLAEGLWSHDGKWLVFRTSVLVAGAGDILAIRPGVDSVPTAIVATTFAELSPSLSPDDHWLVYSSTESGKNEIFVVPFPNAGTAKWPISTSGGVEPLWSHSGREIFYRDGAGNMVSVEVKTTPTFSLGATKTLFPASHYFSYAPHRQYDVFRDDKRFLMVAPSGQTATDKMIVVDNWFDELKAKSRK
jgi:serine/threonine protein kinase/Tol biopolymer transport system component